MKRKIVIKHVKKPVNKVTQPQFTANSPEIHKLSTDLFTPTAPPNSPNDEAFSPTGRTPLEETKIAALESLRILIWRIQVFQDHLRDTEQSFIAAKRTIEERLQHML